MATPDHPQATSGKHNMPLVVGIGASAGGLAALEKFIGSIPPGNKLAFVVVQHMDPTQKALLPELLQRVTPMRVQQAEEGMHISPGCIYVIAPNTELSVVDGALHTATPSEPRGLRLPVNILFSSLAGALGDRAIAVVLSGVGTDGTQGLQVDVTVQALNEPDSLQGMTMVVFRDIARAVGAKGHKSSTGKDTASAAQIQQYKDEILALRQEARATREELQSSNEELQSTNGEMQTKLDDLSLAQSDMKNVLNSIDIAILFLDQDLNVRRYTDLAANIINLRESDIGRPLSDLTTTLQYPELHDDAEQTLRTLAVCERQIESGDNRWFSVRIIPYRRLDNVIDGVVITLVNITESKNLEASLREKTE